MPPKTRRAIYMAVALIILAGLAAAYLYIHVRAARLVSDTLASALGQPVSVSMVGFGLASGLTLYGIEVKNPPGYQSPYLLNIAALNVRPVYKEILKGRMTLSSIGIFRPKLYVEQNRDGVWDFQPILDHLKKRKPSKFIISVINIKGGRVMVASRGIEILVPEVELKGISTVKPAPVGFSLVLTDDKGITIKGAGSADVFGTPKTFKSKFAVRGEKLYKYFTPPKGLDLKGSSLEANLDVDFDGDSLKTMLDGTLSGVRSVYYKGKAGLDARLKAEAEYLLDKDSLTVHGRLDVPEVFGLEMNGRISGPGKQALMDMELKAAPVDLSRTTPYLPKDMTLTGRLSPGAVTVKGTLRPLRLAARGYAALEKAGFSYAGASVAGIQGKASFRLSDKGTLDADAGLLLLNGRLTSELHYLKGPAVMFKLTGGNLDLSRLGGRLSGLTGILDAGLSGSFNGKNKEARLSYSIKGKGIGLPREKVSVGMISLEGEAVKAADNLQASGTLLAGTLSYGGYALDNLKSGYGYSGNALVLKEISLKEKDLSASVDRLDVKYADGGIYVRLSGGRAGYKKDISVDGVKAEADIKLRDKARLESAKGSYFVGSCDAYGLPVSSLEAGWTLINNTVSLNARADVAGSPARFNAGVVTQGLKNPYLSGNLEGIKLASLKLFERFKLPVSVAEGSADVSLSLKGEDLDHMAGSAFLRIAGLGLNKDGKPLLRGLSGEFKPAYGDKTVTLPESYIQFGESFSLKISGKASRQEKGWSVSGNIELPGTDVAKVQEGVLEALPSTLKWADVAGNAGLDAELDMPAGGAGRLTGELRLDGVRLDLPDQGISVGPARGSVPLDIVFGGAAPKTRPNPFREESFERESYGGLLKKYSVKPGKVGLVIDKASYGFVELDDIALDLKPGIGYYEINWYGMSGFGGGSYGYGLVDYSTGKDRRYALSVIISDVSLSAICDQAPGIKGYLAGRVDGLLRVLVAGEGYRGVAGAAMLWAKDGPDEKRKISKEFLKRLMGSSLKKYMFIGDRRFDTGEMDIIFSGGDIVFDKLLISHTNFLGYRDLYVTVAPVSNKISLEHLLDVVKEVKARAGGM